MKSSGGKQIKKVKHLAAQKRNLPSGYFEFILRLKRQITSSRIRAALSVNQELILLYWDIGRQIKDRQNQEGWGSKVVDRLSRDLSLAFPAMKGFSLRNLKYMRAFAESYKDSSFVQQTAAQIPWFHNCIIIDKLKSLSEREFYIKKTIETPQTEAL